MEVTAIILVFALVAGHTLAYLVSRRRAKRTEGAAGFDVVKREE